MQATGYVGSRRDTTMLYRYSYATNNVGQPGEANGWRAWRLRITNPGIWMMRIWMMHCNILQHIILGMSTAWSLEMLATLCRTKLTLPVLDIWRQCVWKRNKCTGSDGGLILKETKKLLCELPGHGRRKSMEAGTERSCLPFQEGVLTRSHGMEKGESRQAVDNIKLAHT
jgi:hypothetical protein